MCAYIWLRVQISWPLIVVITGTRQTRLGCSYSPTSSWKHTTAWWRRSRQHQQQTPPKHDIGGFPPSATDSSRSSAALCVLVQTQLWQRDRATLPNYSICPWNRDYGQPGSLQMIDGTVPLPSWNCTRTASSVPIIFFIFYRLSFCCFVR